MKETVNALTYDLARLDGLDTWEERLDDILQQRRENAKPDNFFGMVPMDKLELNEEERRIRMAIKLKPWMGNIRNEFHGGACSAIFDIVAGASVASYYGHMSTATMDIYVNYISRAQIDDTLIVDVQITHAGRLVTRCNMRAYSERTGRLIATCSTNYMVIGNGK